MNNIIERLREKLHGGRPWMDLLDEAANTIATLQGEAHVLRYLLTKALEVLETIEADCAAEYEELDALKDQIEAALKGELKS